MENLTERVAFVRALREFGETELGLSFGESFKEFAPHHAPPQWLYVSERYRIRSIFDYSGYPYLGNFQKKEVMESLASGFERLGFDIYLFTAEAWGGEACQILPLLLKQTRARQAYVVLHEGWHITVHQQKIKIPYELEEPTAIVIADMGASAFAEKENDKTLFNDTIRFGNVRTRFTDAFCDALAYLKMGYEELRGLSGFEKEKARQRLLSDVAHNPVWREATEAGVLMGGVSRLQPINNAFFVRYEKYYQHLPLVESAARRLRKPQDAVQLFRGTPEKLEDALCYLKEVTKAKK